MKAMLNVASVALAGAIMGMTERMAPASEVKREIEAHNAKKAEKKRKQDLMNAEHPLSRQQRRNLQRQARKGDRQAMSALACRGFDW